MASLNIRLTEEQLNKIKENANRKNMDVTTYVLGSCGVNDGNDLTIDDLIDKVDKVPVGDQFIISSLYDYQTWCDFSRTSKMSVGRIFYKSLVENKFNLQEKIKFIRKNSANVAIYERI